jgi:DNA polymerase elongation subunit (family B)
MGWNTQGEPNKAGKTQFFDLSILYERCKKHGITQQCIVKLGNKGLPYIRGDHKHIDLLNVYSKEVVKDGMYPRAYRTNKLDDVSKGLLGYGKYNNHSGADFKALSFEEQIQYSLTDSKLVMDLAKYRDYEALDAMLAIAEITRPDIQKICQIKLATWWGTIFDNMIAIGEYSTSYRPIEYIDSPEGAHVIPPKWS